MIKFLTDSVFLIKFLNVQVILIDIIMSLSLCYKWLKSSSCVLLEVTYLNNKTTRHLIQLQNYFPLVHNWFPFYLYFSVSTIFKSQCYFFITAFLKVEYIFAKCIIKSP